MNETELNDLLRQTRVQALPPLPAAFQPDVWREIRYRLARSRDGHTSFWTWLLDPMLRPGPVFAAVTLALMLGFVLAVRETHAQVNRTRAALDLQVFTNSAPTLPSTLLARQF